ncbi:MAG: hypothetical protein R3Y56_11155, partial [Akkermansia sp.]
RERRHLLREVAGSVIDMASGRPEQKVLNSLREKFFAHYSNQASPERQPDWVKKHGLPDESLLAEILQQNRTTRRDSDIPSEHYQALRICSGLQSASRVLYHLLPMTDDFTSCIARGMSPMQAYSHLLSRELKFDTKEFKDYPLSRVEASENNTDLNQIDRQNQRYVKKFYEVTGEKAEMSLGDNGQQLWRMPTFTNQYTRWHEDKNAAVREYVWRMQLAFRPLLESRDEGLRKVSSSYLFNWGKNFPHEPVQDFTAFDQLSITAINEMLDQSGGLKSSMLPGLVLSASTSRHRVATSTANKSRTAALARANEEKAQAILKGEPSYIDKTEGHFYEVDFKTLNTPYALIKARAHIYWRRMLDTKLLDPAEAFDLLLKTGAAKEDERQDLTRIAPRQEIPMPAYGPKPRLYTKADKQARLDRRNQSLAARLAELSADVQAADIKKSELPQSAREWFRLIHFCPKAGEQPESYAYTKSGSGRTLLSWANRRSANELSQRSPRWASLRGMENRLKEHPLGLNLKESIGMSSHETQHRAWAHHLGGKHAIDSPYTELWALLTKPKSVWGKMDAQVKEDLAPLIEDQYQGQLEDELISPKAPRQLDAAFENLDAVLKRYPEIAGMSEHPDMRGKVMQMELARPVEDEAHGVMLATRPRMWRGRRFSRQGYELTPAQELPAKLSEDNRVLPAIRLLDTLRSFIANRPQKVDAGIMWNGELYG